MKRSPGGGTRISCPTWSSRRPPRAAGSRSSTGHVASSGQSLFVNLEPATFGSTAPREAITLFDRAATELRVMIELTERSLLRDPSEVLRIVAWARARGWGIALDDVGAEPDSLTILPFVAPDVIKLDMSLIHNQPGVEQGRIMAAVFAHAEATGATVLAEGIETPAHVEQAHALGATLGQGWFFGRPGPLPRSAPRVAPIALSRPGRRRPRWARLAPRAPDRPTSRHPARPRVVVVGPHYAGALIAADCGDDGPDMERRFEFVVTHDRAIVIDAARSLLDRLVPLD